MFFNFHGVNTSGMADCKLSTCQLVCKISGHLIIGSSKWVGVSSSTSLAGSVHFCLRVTQSPYHLWPECIRKADTCFLLVAETPISTGTRPKFLGDARDQVLSLPFLIPTAQHSPDSRHWDINSLFQEEPSHKHIICANRYLIKSPDPHPIQVKVSWFPKVADHQNFRERLRKLENLGCPFLQRFWFGR